ncbi:MAG TPA: transglutaminase domain-containing protein [Anaerolineaceae bacterium]|nr:transglutaminase domain-containing protein [Anaerolineaceae bacterium]HPN51864.1 transglutaminase domain-containing protein [Anaerolineaceae bacterium]
MMERFQDAFWNFLRRHAPLAALMGCLVGLTASILGTGRWRADLSALSTCYLLGALCGWALVRSRLKGWLAAAYSLGLSLLVCFFLAGQVGSLTMFRALSGDELWWMVNLRTLTALDLLRGGWCLPLTAGCPNLSLFYFTAAFLAWNAAAWLLWMTFRRWQALLGLLPSAALVVLALNFNRDGNFPLYWLVCAALLLLYAAYRGRLETWARLQVDYPELILENWLITGLVTVVLVYMVGWAASPQGWELVRDLLTPRPTPAAVSPANQKPDGKTPTPAATQDVPAVSGLTVRMPDMENIHVPLPKSDEAVMWVTLNEPAPLPPEAGEMAEQEQPPRHYWRAAIFAEYTGTGWKAAPDASPETRLNQTGIGRYSLKQHFEITAEYGDLLFAANAPVSTTAGLSLRAVAGDGLALVSGEPTQTDGVAVYDVFSEVSNASGLMLEEPRGSIPDAVKAVYLQLPETLPQRVRDLAARLTENAPNVFQKAQAVQNYLRFSYPYTLDVPPLPRGSDLVDNFLFESQGGFCSHYASAMVVLLRASGVPARLVTGFAMGEYDYDRKAYRVPARAAHAWVEVYFPVYGWVEFEPTAAFTPFDFSSPEMPTPAAAQKGGALAPVLNLPWQPALIGLGVLAGLVLSVRLLLRQRERVRSGWYLPENQVRRLYWELRRGLRAAGRSGTASITPLEYLAAMQNQLPTGLLAALTRATALYEQAVFTTRPVSAEQVRALRSLVRRTAWARLKLRWQRREKQKS